MSSRESSFTLASDKQISLDHVQLKLLKRGAVGVSSKNYEGALRNALEESGADVLLNATLIHSKHVSDEMYTVRGDAYKVEAVP